MKLLKPVSALLALTLVGAQLFACGKTDTTTTPSDGLDENGFFKGVKASEIVTLPTYKGAEYDADILIASEEEVQTQLDSVLANFSTYERITDRAVADGDTVNIDYVGSVDGVEFEGGTTQGAGTDVTIGETSYIDDFLEQLIGHKPGETINVEVTFPTPYENNPDLAGKDAVFVTTINYIQGDYIKAELTSEIASSYGFDTPEALIENIEEWVIEKQKNEFFWNLLADATVSDLPQSVIDYIVEEDLSRYDYYATMTGMTVEQVLVQFYGYESKQAYIDGNMESYEAAATQYLAAQAIAEIEGITVSDADLEAEGFTQTQFDEYGKPYIKQYVLFQTKLPDFVIGNGKAK